MKYQIAKLEHEIIYAVFNELQTTIDDVVLEFNILNQSVNDNIIKKIEQDKFSDQHLLYCCSFP